MLNLRDFSNRSRTIKLVTRGNPMGEFADYALRETEAAEWDRYLWRSGAMGDLEAYDLGIIDELGFENRPSGGSFPVGRSQRSAYRTQHKCTYCGAVGLVWKQTDAGWRLHNASGDAHTCQAYFDKKYGRNDG